jgi:hypothetical protein
MPTRFIEIREPETVSAGEVAQAAEETGADLALLIRNEKPVALLEVDDLEIGDEVSIVESVDEESALEETFVPIELPAGELGEVDTYFRGVYVIVLNEDQPLLVEANQSLETADDIRDLIESGDLRAVSADTRLPKRGPPPPPPPDVDYICENGHIIPAPPDQDPDAKCPYDQTRLKRDP